MLLKHARLPFRHECICGATLQHADSSAGPNKSKNQGTCSFRQKWYYEHLNFLKPIAMGLRLAEAVERIEDKRQRRELKTAMDRVRTYSGDISNALIRSRAEMREAAGMYLPANNEIHFREDQLHDAKELETTGHHEKEHQGKARGKGNIVEGLAEERATRLAGTRPTSKLVDQVRSAQKIISILGRERTYELARNGMKGPVLLEQELLKQKLGTVLKFPANKANAHRIETAQKEVRALVNQATYYKGQAPLAA